MFLLQSCLQSSNSAVDTLKINADSIQSTGFFSKLKIFANNSALKDWDYAALFIAIVALIIAILTLRSQWKTQENTKYLIKPSTQREVFFMSLVRKMTDLDLILFYIKALFDSNDFGKVRYNISLLKGIKFQIPDISYLIEDKDSLFSITNLCKLMNEFNLLIDHVVYCIDYNLIDKKQISALLKQLYDGLHEIANSWVFVYFDLLYQSEKKKHIRIKKILRIVKKLTHLNKIQNYIDEKIEAEKLGCWREVNWFLMFGYTVSVRAFDLEEYNNLEERFKIDYKFVLPSSVNWSVEKEFIDLNQEHMKESINNRIQFENKLLSGLAVSKYNSDIEFSIPKKMNARTIIRKKRIHRN